MFGNPFIFNKEKDRLSSIEKYKEWIYDKINKEPEFLKAILDLKGKILACNCKPKKCHGDIIIEIINNLSK